MQIVLGGAAGIVLALVVEVLLAVAWDWYRHRGA